MNKSRAWEFYARALQDYRSRNKDELSFKCGTIIEILTKESGEDGWWLGVIKGQSGLVPSNFLVPVPMKSKNAKFEKKKVRNDLDGFAEKLQQYYNPNSAVEQICRHCESKIAGRISSNSHITKLGTPCVANNYGKRRASPPFPTKSSLPLFSDNSRPKSPICVIQNHDFINLPAINKSKNCKKSNPMFSSLQLPKIDEAASHSSHSLTSYSKSYKDTKIELDDCEILFSGNTDSQASESSKSNFKYVNGDSTKIGLVKEKKESKCYIGNRDLVEDFDSLKTELFQLRSAHKKRIMQLSNLLFEEKTKKEEVKKKIKNLHSHLIMIADMF